MQTKTALFTELDAARDELWGLVEGISATAEIYPGWNLRDFFAHIAGWEAMVFEVFRDHLSGVSGKPYPYTGVDDANARFVATRQSATLEDAKLECEINRFAIKTLLADIPEADFGQSVRLPWGLNTVTEFLEGAIEHERDHAADIRGMREAGRL
jgi:hypothetical protein